MIDAEQYIAELWTLSFTAESLQIDDQPTGLWVAPDIDVSTLAELPALTWNLTGDGEAVDGPNAESFILNANIFGDGMDQAKATAMHVDDVVTGWMEDPAVTRIALTDYGISVVVSRGERIDMPSRLASAEIDGRNVVQYSGSYRLLLRWF